jgi:hypothetical protein
MKRITFLFLLAALLIPLSAVQLYPVDLKKGTYVQSPPSVSELAVTINLLGEKGDVYGPGKEIRFSFRTTKDAYVIIYNIDSEGYVNLLWPEDGRLVMSEGHKTYFLPDPAKDVHWETGGKTGVEYIHALAVSKPGRINGDELSFLAGNDRLSEDKRFRIDMDPFLAFNSIDEELVSGAEQERPATDYTYFHINRRVEYPRYLCSKCHSPEKLPDPYAMECPEIVIEKVAYDEDPHYPYPPLYDIRHVGEKDQEDDYYSSGRYSEKWLGEEADEHYGDYEASEDTHIYLSMGYGNYGYPFYSYWPYYRPYFPVYYWDPFWWDFSWNVYWGYYDWWPSYGWAYSPNYYYWTYYSRYPWWGCGHDWAQSDHRHRPVLAERTITKRYIDYQRTNTGLHRTRTLADSRLMKVRTESAMNRIERVNLQKRMLERSLDRTELLRPERGASRNREMERRIIYGGPRVGRESGRSLDGNARSRQLERSRNAIDARKPRSERQTENRDAPQTRENPSRERKNESGRDAIKRSTPERRSPDAGRRDSPPSRSSDSPKRERSKSGNRSDSNVDKRRTSGFSTSTVQRSSPAPSRHYSAPAQSVSRSRLPAPTAARSASAPAATRSRSR